MKKNIKVWLNYFISLLKKYLDKIIVDENSNYFKFYIKDHRSLFFILNFLKNHSLFKFKILTDIASVDFLKASNRFELNYLLLSLKYNIRIVIAVTLDEFASVQSVTSIFSNANWCEREIWDLFGIFFINHNDLRRILTDYGFKGHPLRKDFPLNGFVEIRYDEDKQYLVYEEIELMQNLRFYDFLNPIQNKYLI